MIGQERAPLVAGTRTLLSSCCAVVLVLVTAVSQSVPGTWSAMMVTNLSQLEVGGRVLTEQWVDTLAVVSSLTCNAMGIAAARVTDTLRGHMKAHHICNNTMDNVDSQ